MPYIVAQEISVSPEASASFTMPISEGHAANDILLAIVTQDGGGTTIAATGWTNIGTQGDSQGQRTAALWKLASSDSESDFSATGANNDWTVSIIVIRNANTTTPIHQNDRTNSSDSSSASLASGTVTTTENNCLIIHAFGWDSSRRLLIQNPSSLVNLTKLNNSGGGCQIVGYHNQISSGTTPVVTAISESDSEGGCALTLAISDAAPASAKMGPDCSSAFDVLKYYGGYVSGYGFIVSENITWQVATYLTPTSIDSVPVTDLTITEREETLAESEWGYFSAFRITGSATDDTGVWCGKCHTITSTDMTGKIFSLEFQLSGGFSLQGSKGVCVVFEDSSGNWAAFQMAHNEGLTYLSPLYCGQVELETATPLAYSGTIDWSDITVVGYLTHKVTASTSELRLIFRNAFLFEQTTFVDGCAESPVSAAFVEKALLGWGAKELAGIQGVGQALFKSGLKFGDGTRKTYVNATGTSFELPLGYSTSVKRRFWKVDDLSDAAKFVLKASANDTINLTSCVMSTETEQEWEIDSASSASATYDFNGLSLIGWAVTHNVDGIVMNNVVFKACRGITLNGGALSGCSIVQSQSSPAVTTDDPENISDCSFVSPGSGHAIEITATGTYSFAGNSFSGYGANGTNDAAIYNNSGGAVTLNLSTGAETPTIKNGSGASTTIGLPPFDITLQNVKDGSAWQIYNVTKSTEVDSGTQSGTADITVEDVPYVGDADQLRIRVRKATASPKYKCYIGYATLTGNDITIYVSQVPDE